MVGSIYKKQADSYFEMAKLRNQLDKQVHHRKKKSAIALNTSISDGRNRKQEWVISINNNTERKPSFTWHKVPKKLCADVRMIIIWSKFYCKVFYCLICMSYPEIKLICYWMLLWWCKGLQLSGILIVFIGITESNILWLNENRISSWCKMTLHMIRPILTLNQLI